MPSTFDQRIEARQTLINQTRDEIEEITGAMDDATRRLQTERLVEATERLARHERALAALTAAQRAQAPAGRTPSRETGRELVPIRGRAAALAPRRSTSSGPTARFAASAFRSGRTPKKKELDRARLHHPQRGHHAARAPDAEDARRGARPLLWQRRSRRASMFNIVQKAADDAGDDRRARLGGGTRHPAPGRLHVPPDAGRDLPASRRRGACRLTSAAPAASTSRRGSGPPPSPARSSAKASPSRSARRCFAAQIVTPKKLGVITVMTREIEEHSIPAIEGLLRRAIMEDTGQVDRQYPPRYKRGGRRSASGHPQRHYADDAV